MDFVQERKRRVSKLLFQSIVIIRAISRSYIEKNVPLDSTNRLFDFERNKRILIELEFLLMQQDSDRLHLFQIVQQTDDLLNQAEHFFSMYDERLSSKFSDTQRRCFVTFVTDLR